MYPYLEKFKPFYLLSVTVSNLLYSFGRLKILHCITKQGHKVNSLPVNIHFT